MLQHFGKLFEGHLVLLCNGVHGLVELVVIDAHTRAVRHLHLQVFKDDLIQYLFAQLSRRWYWSGCFRNLLLYLYPALVEFTLQHNLVVDDSDDFIDCCRLCVRAADTRQGHTKGGDNCKCKKSIAHIHVPDIH